ncbi:thioester domain-containing protein [uncultured Cutibacterium sp.]|uniref:thioester domain-containing protein n=1 Tax=uncultured Cutibacterium sp. TaxID=1912223 RepID=UPI002805707E|nr:thioester domain-containing protein [uncultured Cutibacterium sp.]
MRKVLINAGLGVLSALVGGAGFLTPVQANAAPGDADQPTNPGFSEGYPKPLPRLETPIESGLVTVPSDKSMNGPNAGWGDGSPDELMKVAIGPDKYAYVYCVEPGTEYFTTDKKPKATMSVGDWSEYKFKGKTPVAITSDTQRQEAAQWITENGYPSKSIDQLESESGIKNLTKEEAISATRFSLLHYVDGRELDKVNQFIGDGRPAPAASPEAAKAVRDLYGYLTGPKNTGAPLDSDKKVAKVTVTGPSGTGVAGQPVGPIRFGGSEKTLPLTVSDPASDWEIVDADGNAIDKDKAPVGKDLYLKVPADAPAGSATISTSVKKSNLSGKVLFEKSGKKHGQTTVIIDSDDSESSASVSVSWDAAQEPTPTPTPSDTPTPTPSDTPTPTPSDTPSVTPTPTPCVPGQGGTDENGNPCETPTPTPSATPTPSDTPTPEPTPCLPGDTSEGCITPAPTPSDTPTPTPSDTPSATPTPSDTPSTCVPGQGGTDENGNPCETPAPSVTPAPSSTPTACVPGQGGTDENGKPCVVVPTTCVPAQDATADKPTTADKHGAAAKDKAGKTDVCAEPGLPATGV